MEPIRRAIGALGDRQRAPAARRMRRGWFLRATAVGTALARRLAASPAATAGWGREVMQHSGRLVDRRFSGQLDALRRVAEGVVALRRDGHRWVARGVVVGGAAVSLLVGLAVGGAFQGVDVALAPPGQATSPTVEFAAPTTAPHRASSAGAPQKPATAAAPSTTAPASGTGSVTSPTAPPSAGSGGAASPPPTTSPSTPPTTAPPPTTTPPPSTTTPPPPTTQPGNPVCVVTPSLCGG